MSGGLDDASSGMPDWPYKELIKSHVTRLSNADSGGTITKQGNNMQVTQH